MSNTINAMELALKFIESVCIDSCVAEALREAIAAEVDPGIDPAWYLADCDDPKYSSFHQYLNDAEPLIRDHGGYITELFARPFPSDTELLAGKLALMTAERDKMQLELNDLRALRAGHCSTGDRGALIKRLREGQTYDPTSGDLQDMSWVMDDAADALETDEQQDKKHPFQLWAESATKIEGLEREVAFYKKLYEKAILK
jgi:hypothetical protein